MAIFLSALFLIIVTSVASAGTLEGKVSAGNSVVYVDAIPGKTFPAPSKTALVSQRGLAYVPHIIVV